MVIFPCQKLPFSDQVDGSDKIRVNSCQEKSFFYKRDAFSIDITSYALLINRQLINADKVICRMASNEYGVICNLFRGQQHLMNE